MRLLVLISLILTCIVSSAQEDNVVKNCGNCKHKIEYCDPYESTCQPCEAICLPPTNQKFTECGKLCANFLQDILIDHYNEPKHQIHLNTVEALLILITGLTSISMILLLTLLVMKIGRKGRRKVKSDIIPMYQVEGSTIRTISTSVPETSVGTNTITSRIPTEDRAPSTRDSNESYENPLMIPNTRNRLPPL